MDTQRLSTLWRRLAADNDFQTWLAEQEEEGLSHLLSATGETLYRVQGRVQVLRDMRRNVERAKNG